jgi:mono/diheme cytochrome c family protein
MSAVGLGMALATGGYASGSVTLREDPEFLYDLHCSGCHKQDGSGQGVFVPRLKDEMAVLLRKPGGREYMLQVPGVSQSSLSDADVAKVMNWALSRFDAEHLPSDFKPFTAAEVARFRHAPLSDATRVRAQIMAK